MKSFAWRTTRKLLVIGTLLAAVAAAGILYYMQVELPDIDALNTTHAQAPLRIYTKDAKLIAEFGEKRSNPIPFEQIPKPLIDAVLATEDQHYYQHPGIDISGLLRAGVKLVLTGKKEEGGSTITMQVARNFYLSRHKTFGRKLQEILLAIKIDHGLTKQKILELYLNTIFLGNRAYGVGAAAEIYYGKPLAELSLDQYAMLAGLPKAPSALNPIANPDAAKKRRDHVLNRMRETSVISEADYQAALKAPLAASYHDLQVATKAPYAAEFARQQLEEMYGDSIYTDGFNVYTTIDSQLQENANTAVHDKVLAYDQRHGYRGPEKNIGSSHVSDPAALQKILASTPNYGIEPAIVTRVAAQSATAMRADGSSITLAWQGMAWARRQVNADYLGHVPAAASEILKPGDVIRIVSDAHQQWRLAQLPRAEAGFVALNPQNGSIVAMVGGFDFQRSNFNRIVNAQRQPGSSFKPFVYSAALEKGYTLASVINDAPVVVDNPDGSVWRPQNDTHEFYGPTRLRNALTHSLNLVSIRLLQQVEIPYAINHIERFGFTAQQLPTTLSLALGTANVTPLDMVSSYAVFANSGFRVTPFIIDSIRNSQNEVIYQARPLTACSACTTDVTATEAVNQVVDNSHAPQAISPQNAYLITSALHDVIERGTATQARSLHRSDLAGKTGTTQNQVDAWFVGYNPELVALAWMGFDQPQSLHEYGSKAALPMWIQFMEASLKDKPDHGVQQPTGIMSIRVDPLTGSQANANDPQAIGEYFMEPYLPTGDANENKAETEAASSASNGTVY